MSDWGLSLESIVTLHQVSNEKDEQQPFCAFSNIDVSFSEQSNRCKQELPIVWSGTDRNGMRELRVRIISLDKRGGQSKHEFFVRSKKKLEGLRDDLLVYSSRSDHPYDNE